MKKYWLFILIIVFHLGFNLIFLNLNKMPPAWDQAAHIRSSIVWGKVMSGELRMGFKDLIGQSWGYPPLMMFLGGLWSIIFGAGVIQITFLNTLFLIGGIIGVYVLTKELSRSDLGATMAALLFSFFPIVYDISRNYLLDLPLTVWVVWAIWALIKSHFLVDFNKYTILFIGCFLFSALTKFNGFIYFGPMFVYALYRAFKDDQIKIIKNLFIIAAIFVVGVGWWYVVNYKNIYAYLKVAGAGEVGSDPMNLLKLETWIFYFKLFCSQQATAITSLLFLTALPFWKKMRIEKHKRGFILLFLGLNYLIFTIIKNKDTRFTMPLLPMMAVIMGLGLVKLEEINKLAFKILLGFLVSYMVITYLANSFEWPIKKEHHLSFNLPVMGTIDLFNISEHPVRSVKTKIWPQKEIIEDIDDNLKMLVLINKEEINSNNLRLYAELANKSVLLETVPNSWQNETELQTYIDGMDYVLMPDVTYETAPYYAINLQALNQARDYVLGHQENWKIINVYKIYDNKNLYLIKRL